MFGRAAPYSAFMLHYWTCQLQAGRGHGPCYWLVAGNPSLPARQFSRGDRTPMVLTHYLMRVAHEVVEVCLS
jgi:hypothetical protein